MLSGVRHGIWPFCHRDGVRYQTWLICQIGRMPHPSLGGRRTASASLPLPAMFYCPIASVESRLAGLSTVLPNTRTEKEQSAPVIASMGTACPVLYRRILLYPRARSNSMTDRMPFSAMRSITGILAEIRKSTTMRAHMQAWRRFDTPLDNAGAAASASDLDGRARNSAQARA